MSKCTSSASESFLTAVSFSRRLANARARESEEHSPVMCFSMMRKSACACWRSCPDPHFGFAFARCLLLIAGTCAPVCVSVPHIAPSPTPPRQSSPFLLYASLVCSERRPRKPPGCSALRQPPLIYGVIRFLWQEGTYTQRYSFLGVWAGSPCWLPFSAVPLFLLCLDLCGCGPDAALHGMALAVRRTACCVGCLASFAFIFVLAANRKQNWEYICLLWVGQVRASFVWGIFSSPSYLFSSPCAYTHTK